MANDIIITKVNEVYAKIKCEKHLAKELSEYFTFFVPGYKFTPAYKNKIWDGKIRLFSLQTYQIYLGLFTYIKDFCDERGYTLECDDDIELEDEFSLYIATKFIKSLNLHSAGRPIEAREHQINAFVASMQKKRSLLLSPTASGKSLIIYLIFRQLLDFQNLKGLVLVPNTSLVEQLSSDFTDYSSETKFDVDRYVHKIYQGRDKMSSKKLIISTWQSLYNMPEQYFEQFDYVIGDEAHLFKAQSLTSIMTACINAKYRIGLTGTLDGTKTHKLCLEGLFGPVKKVITTKELIDKKQLSDFQIKCLVLKHDEELCSLMKGKSYQEEIDYIIHCEKRNKFIKNLAVSMKKNTLILFQVVEKHGKVLYNMIKDTKELGNRKVYFISGEVDTLVREEIRKTMETEDNAIIIASYGTFSTGVNIKNIHNIIFASPSKSRVRNLQSIGRGLRKSDEKDVAILYDISDDLRSGKYINHTLKHFVERTKIYSEEKFTYKLYKIGLHNGSKNTKTDNG